MADLDAILSSVRTLVDRFVFEACVVDLAPIRADEGLMPLDDVVDAFGAWLVARDDAAPRYPSPLTLALIEHFLIRATSRVKKKYDARVGRSRLYVNIELREQGKDSRSPEAGSLRHGAVH